MKFSIITPSYNQGNFIQQTIDSVINQKGDFEVEYFVIDGGSTDNTVDILKKTEAKLRNNPKIKFYWQSQKDSGQSDAINQGLKKATGDILSYINSDDTYMTDCFKKVASAFKTSPSQKWLIGYCNIVDKNNLGIQKLITRYKDSFLKRYSYRKLLALNFICQPATFWTHSILDDFGHFNDKLHLAMDYEYWLRIGRKYKPIILKSKIANFRIHSGSKGKRIYDKQFSEDYAIAKQYTNSIFLLLTHKIHNEIIKSVYRIIK